MPKLILQCLSKGQKGRYKRKAIATGEVMGRIGTNIHLMSALISPTLHNEDPPEETGVQLKDLI